MLDQITYKKFAKNELLIHVLIWLVVLFYPYLKYAGREGGYMMSFSHELVAMVFKMSIAYLLYFVVFPKIHQLKYALLALTFLLLNSALYEFFDGFFHKGERHFWVHFMTNLLTYLSFSIVFFASYSVKQLYKKQLELNRLGQEKQTAEMQALKAQINPHFLFNTLNTIYANALKNDSKTPDLILKLSNGFKYLLHQGQKERVSLKEEVRHLRDYISLQETRLSKKVKVLFHEAIEDDTKLIAPLLLIPFIENAFKYTSILRGEDHHIEAFLSTDNDELVFECKNPYSKSHEIDTKNYWQQSGIGINNTKKRLQLLYPEKHRLLINNEAGIYEIKLYIRL